MKISCNIIKDLLPLYVDDCLSDDSRVMVGEHLAECEDCSEYKESLTDEPVLSTGKIDAAAPLKKIKQKLFKKNIIIALVVAVCVGASGLGIFEYIFHYDTPVEYDSGNIYVKEASDKVLDVYVEGNFYGTQSMVDEKNNEVYISMTRTIGCSINKKDDVVTHAMSINPNTILVSYYTDDDANKPQEIKGKLEKIYYMSSVDKFISEYPKTDAEWKDYNKRLEAAKKDAILIWESKDIGKI